MFERRQRISHALGFNHVQRSLKRGETIPALPGLCDQLRACRHEMARARREHHEEEVEPEVRESDDEGYLFDD